MEDSEIIELYRSGEKDQAFNLIVRKYKERLYWHIRQMVNDHEEANDLLQDTFIKVWGALETFREDAKLYTWLYRIATNETITSLRKSRIKSALFLGDYSKQAAERLQSDEFFSGDELQLALHKAIAKLPPRQKAVFTMRYFDELKYEEISEILETSVGSLKASYHHAYNKVQEWVRDEVEK
jgi:RNA polymerase sigma factor, sigma-70 family